MNSMHLLPRSRWVSGAQWFTYTYAGDWWNGPMSGHYSQQFLTDYLGGLRERGGVMMLNVQVDDFGNIDPATYASLVEARKALRDKNANRRVLRNSTGLSGVVYGGSGWQQRNRARLWLLAAGLQRLCPPRQPQRGHHENGHQRRVGRIHVSRHRRFLLR